MKKNRLQNTMSRRFESTERNKKTKEREETTMVLSDKRSETWTPYSPKPAQNNCHALKLTKQY